MKFVEITLFLFILNVCMAFTNATGILHSSYAPDTKWFSDINVENDSYVAGTIQTNTDWTGDFIKGFFMFIKTFGKGVINLKFLFGSFGVVEPITTFLTIPFYLVYVIAIVQFIANRFFKSMS